MERHCDLSGLLQSKTLGDDMSNQQQENRPGRFATKAQRKHVREMFAQYSLDELRAIRAEIDKLITLRLDSSNFPAVARSREACA